MKFVWSRSCSSDFIHQNQLPGDIWGQPKASLRTRRLSICIQLTASLCVTEESPTDYRQTANIYTEDFDRKDRWNRRELIHATLWRRTICDESIITSQKAQASILRSFIKHEFSSTDSICDTLSEMSSTQCRWMTGCVLITEHSSLAH